MLIAEYEYAQHKNRSTEAGRDIISADKQRHFRPDEPGPVEAVGIPGRCIYAQNENYLEICNPGFEENWKSGMVSLIVGIGSALIIAGWYGLALNPFLFGNFYFFGGSMRYDHPDQNIILWVSWLIFFPMAIGAVFLLYLWFIKLGARANFFSDLRVRIRFNRKTRKVYVLRPDFCGGSRVFNWDELVALMSRFVRDDPRYSTATGMLILYFGPNHAKTPKDEDAIFVGNTYHSNREEQAGLLWEYIRRYMEIGPTVDKIPPNAPTNFLEVARYLPADYFTFCGKPSINQFQMENGVGLTEGLLQMLSQITCRWPRFPPEWQSDSGLGEPEDRPVQTGAVMTALVYRAKGRLSPQDEVEFLTHYGTPEALAEAKARA